MKTADAAIRTVLLLSPEVALLVGTKVYPIMAPSSTAMPFITYRRGGIQRQQTLQNPAGVPRVSFDVQVYALTYEEARGVADAVRQTLDGYAGTIDNTVIHQASLENEADDFVALAGADMPPAYQITLTYDVWWQESQ